MEKCIKQVNRPQNAKKVLSFLLPKLCAGGRARGRGRAQQAAAQPCGEWWWWTRDVAGRRVGGQGAGQHWRLNAARQEESDATGWRGCGAEASHQVVNHLENPGNS
jgi:hypothetical protein